MSGAAVVEVDDSGSRDLPATWSPSSVNTFLKCPLAYWWQYRQGWRSAPTAALLAGTLVHGVLEELLALPPEDRTRQRAREIYAEHAALLEPDLGAGVDPADLRARAGLAMTSYFDLADPRAVEVAPDGLERAVAADLGGVPIAGSVDLVEFAVGGVRVVDYKTGGAKPRYAEAYWRQLLLYAAMLEDDGADVAEVALLHLGDPARVMVRPVAPSAVRRVVGDLGRADDERSEHADSSAWPAKVGPLCSHCGFRSVCPARSDRLVPVPGSAASQQVLEASRELVWRPPRGEEALAQVVLGDEGADE